MGGGSKKKDKKKKKKRYSSDEEDRKGQDHTDDYPTLEEHYGSQDGKSSRYKTQEHRKGKDSSKSVPRTEEYVYDYSGQEMVQGARDMSPDPDDRYSRGSSKSHKKSYDYDGENKNNRSEYRDRSPIRKERRKDMTPPPLPPGMDWPFEKSHPKSPVDDWKQKDDIRRDREYQDEVDRKYRAQQKEERKQKAGTYIVLFSNAHHEKEVIVYFH